MKGTEPETFHFAEYVSPGHPDRLADAIAEAFVKRGMQVIDPSGVVAACGGGYWADRSLVAIEVAIHDDHVFLDGRYAYEYDEEATIEQHEKEFAKDVLGIVHKVYQDAGYGSEWYPDPQQLKVHNTICFENLEDGEAEFREYSDDQNLVIGYAEPTPETNCLPPAHFVANRLGRALVEWRKGHAGTYGPDFKVLPCLRRVGSGSKVSWQWERLTLSVQHKTRTFFEQQYGDLLPILEDTLQSLEQETGLTGLASSFSIDHLLLNGAGDFCQGGPEADNGLSGKKLVVDHYGPDVPIGGGAICGKDPHKIDKAGALRARQLAKRLAIQHQKPARVRLAWSPGDKEPFLIEAALETEGIWQYLNPGQLPPSNWFKIETIFQDLKLSKVDWPQVVLDGYFADPHHPWEQ